MKREKREKYVHLSIIIIGAILLLIPIMHTNLWFDESYSVAIVKYSFKDIFKIASYDVHPILYYYLLHIVYLVFGNNLICYRTLSWLFLVINSLLGYTHIRKDFGTKEGKLFSFFSIVLPGIMIYADEIRMYSLGFLLSSLLLIYAFRLYKQKSLKNYIFFGLFSILLCYTHYYGLMLAGIVNLALLYSLIREKEKKNLIIFVFVGVIEVLLYLPWLINFISQFESVSKGFWIKFTFPKSLINLICVQFKGLLSDTLSIIYTVIIYGYLIIFQRKNKCQKQINWCWCLYLVIILISTIVSLLMSTMILLERYLIIISPLIIFIISFSLSCETKKKYYWGICLVVLSLFMINEITWMKNNYHSLNNESFDYLESNVKKGDIILYKDIIGSVFTTKLSLSNSYFYNYEKWNIYDAYYAFAPYLNIVDDLSFLDDYHGKIWIIDIKEPIELLKEMDKSKIKVLDKKEFYSLYKDEKYFIEVVEKN